MNDVTIEIIDRGEEVRYADGDKTLTAGIYIHGKTIDFEAYTICSWDKPRGVALTETERQIVIDRIVRYLQTRTSRVVIHEQKPLPTPPAGPIGREVWEYRRKLGIIPKNPNDIV